MSQMPSHVAPEPNLASSLPSPVVPISFSKRSAWLRYGVAAAIVPLAIVAVRFGFPTLWERAPLAPLLGLSLAIAYLAGPGPSLLVTLLTAVIVDYFFFTPGSLIVHNTSLDNLRMGTFVLLGTLGSWISHQWTQRNATLRDREQKLRILLEKMPVVLWSTDGELRLTSSSAAMVHLFPSSRSIDLAEGEVDPETFRAAPRDALYVTAQRRAVAGESISYDWTIGERSFHVHVEPLATTPRGGSFGMAWDITAQQRAEKLVLESNQELEARVARRTEELANANLVLMKQIADRRLAESQRDAQREQAASERAARAEAEAANRAKDHFLATLSHELRTPMAPVLMTVSSMENDTNLPEETRASLRMIRRNVELEARLIDDLLDLTRISSGKLELKSSDTDVHSLICHARDVCLPDAEAKRQRIELQTGARQCYVRGDATRLQQVFWNLLRNAVKFTPDCGEIRVRTFNDEGGCLIAQVIDSGIGIDPAVLPRIFDAFEQGGQQITRRFGGLGLGLAISKAVVDLHGGTLAVHSDGPGKGSTFTVALRTIAAPLPAEATPVPTTQKAQSLRILLVEDHADTRRATARLLRLLGHQVADADGVSSALQTAGSGSFDLMISDLGLPDGSGLDLMRQIKRLYNLKGIALSGFGMDSDLRNSTEAGFDCHLVKPVPLEQLEAAVRQVGGMEVGAGH